MEGWPFPRYLGSCGRLVVSASTRPLRDFFGAAAEVAADLALQLLAVLRSMATNDLNYFFYFTRVDAGTFGVFSNGHLFIRDASTLGIIDKEEGTQRAPGRASVMGGLGRQGRQIFPFYPWLYCCLLWFFYFNFACAVCGLVTTLELAAALSTHGLLNALI